MGREPRDDNGRRAESRKSRCCCVPKKAQNASTNAKCDDILTDEIRIKRGQTNSVFYFQVFLMTWQLQKSGKYCEKVPPGSFPGDFFGCSIQQAFFMKLAQAPGKVKLFPMVLAQDCELCM